MKKTLPYLFIFLLASIVSVRFSYAQNIQTGNSDAKATVETNIEGNGNVQTHIETSANGVKKVLDTNGPGTYKVEVKSDGENSSSSPSPAVSASASSTASATPTTVERKASGHNFSSVLNFVNDFKKSIEDLFNRLFYSLKLDKSF